VSDGALVANDERLSESETEAHAKRLLRARNKVLHEGLIPADALDIALRGRDLVIRAIEATVRRAVSGAPAHPAWGNLHRRAIDHARDWAASLASRDVGVVRGPNSFRSAGSPVSSRLIFGASGSRSAIPAAAMRSANLLCRRPTRGRSAEPIEPSPRTVRFCPGPTGTNPLA
jgi:hypothetical protein